MHDLVLRLNDACRPLLRLIAFLFFLINSSLTLLFLRLLGSFLVDLIRSLLHDVFLQLAFGFADVHVVDQGVLSVFDFDGHELRLLALAAHVLQDLVVS